MKRLFQTRALQAGFALVLFWISTLAAYAQAPNVTTNPATGINTNSATLHGTVLTSGSTASAHFDWGTSILYDDATPTVIVSIATSPQPISFTMFGLTPNATYHFRATATNTSGTTDGPDQSFTTSAAPPTVTTQAARNVGSVSAKLIGTVNPNNSPTDARFEWGTTISYGNFTTVDALSAGTSLDSLSFDLGGLSPSTQYHYRTTATNPGGTAVGLDQSFTTPVLFPLPVVITGIAEDLTIASANLAGSVNPNGSPATAHFEYGTTISYGNSTPDLTSGSGTSPVTLKFKVLGLSTNATYHYRAVATNTGGTTFGGDQTFHTPSPGSSPVPVFSNAGLAIALVLLVLSALRLQKKRKVPVS